MRNLTIGLLIFIAGWGLGWLTYLYLGSDTQQSAQPTHFLDSRNADTEANPSHAVSGAPPPDADLSLLLQRNDFESVMERYDSLQRQAGEAVLADAREQILGHVRRLIAGGRFSPAEQLLQRFLTAVYRDVDARVLLAEVYQGQGDILAAIDQLYEARSYAWQPDRLLRLTGRIRSLVAVQVQALKQNADQDALLALYQHLVQVEPDHAPWFMGLASTQLALDDKEAARRSLLLVAQDPYVGTRAQEMLSELRVAFAGQQGDGGWDSATAVAGIPLQHSGNHFVVAARAGHSRSLQLLIDTGASLTIFTPQALERRGIRYQATGKSGVFNTANGRVVAPVYKLDSLAVGDWKVNQLEVGVLELGGRSEVDGLLGMNFLSHFQFFIDQNEGVLRLSAH